MRDCSWLFDKKWGFNNLRQNNFKCSSDRTDHLPCGGYNCIAWAAGKKDKWWWPSDDPCDFWPIPKDRKNPDSVEQFIKAFESEGYRVCENERFENGLEKVAIYLDKDGDPTHAARQLPSGVWTSKMGKAEDIEHETLRVVEGEIYGKAKHFLKRPNPLCQKPNQLKTLFSRLLGFLRTQLKRFSPTAKRNQTSS